MRTYAAPHARPSFHQRTELRLAALRAGALLEAAVPEDGPDDVLDGLRGDGDVRAP